MACTCPVSQCESFTSIYPLATFDHQVCAPNTADPGKCVCTCYLRFPVIGVVPVGALTCPLPVTPPPVGASSSDGVVLVLGAAALGGAALLMTRHRQPQGAQRRRR